MSEEEKSWIDGASYESLLRRWRFASVGDPIFQGESGAYYTDVMKRKREEVGHIEHTRASKTIGWED